MDSNTKRTGICLPGGRGNQEFEAYPLSASNPKKVIHVSTPALRLKGTDL